MVRQVGRRIEHGNRSQSDIHSSGRPPTGWTEDVIATVNQQDIGRPLPATASGESVGKPLLITAPTTSHPKIPTANSGVLQSQVTLWNKYLNDSGQPNRFRVDPNSGETLIQEFNPATGEVIGEYSVSTFPALAKSLGLVGSLVDSRA
jgi:hypothetical protein